MIIGLAEPQRGPKGATWILAGLVALGALLRFTGLADQGFWTDERFTIGVLAGDGFFDVPDQVALTESAPVPYYLIAWLWAAAFGDGETALRSLSALLGTATIPIVFLAVRELSSVRAGLIAAALCACSPILVWYSQEARAFALGVLLAAVTFWLFAWALDESRRYGLLLWAIASTAAIACFYLVGILVLCEAAVLLWRRRDRGLVIAAAAIPAVISLALLPNARDDAQERQAWIADIFFDERIRQVFKFFLVGNGDPASPLVLATAAVVVGAVAFVLLRGEADERRAAVIAGSVGLASIAIAIAGRAFDADYVLARNLLFAWIPLGALVAIALSSRRLGALGSIGAAAICAAGIWLVVDVKESKQLQRADFRPLAAQIDSQPPPGTRAILAPSGFLSQVLFEYLEGASPPSLLFSKVDELVLADHEDVDSDGPCWWGGACAVPQTNLPSSVPGFRVVERSDAGLWTMVRLRARTPTRPQASIGPDFGWYVQTPAAPSP